MDKIPRREFLKLSGAMGAGLTAWPLASQAAGVGNKSSRPNILVFLTADYGLNAGQHGTWEKGNATIPQNFLEESIRIACTVSWPGKLAAGGTYDLPVSSLDVFPTALALAGVPMPTNEIYDGVNLMPYLTGDNTNAPNGKLFWRFGGGPELAVRDGNYKLVRQRKQPVALFNLAADLREANNLANTQTNELKKLDTVANV